MIIFEARHSTGGVAMLFFKISAIENIGFGIATPDYYKLFHKWVLNSSKNLFLILNNKKKGFRCFITIHKK